MKRTVWHLIEGQREKDYYFSTFEKRHFVFHGQLENPEGLYWIFANKGSEVPVYKVESVKTETGELNVSIYHAEGVNPSPPAYRKKETVKTRRELTFENVENLIVEILSTVRPGDSETWPKYLQRVSDYSLLSFNEHLSALRILEMKGLGSKLVKYPKGSRPKQTETLQKIDRMISETIKAGATVKLLRCPNWGHSDFCFVATGPNAKDAAKAIQGQTGGNVERAESIFYRIKNPSYLITHEH